MVRGGLNFEAGTNFINEQYAYNTNGHSTHNSYRDCWNGDWVLKMLSTNTGAYGWGTTGAITGKNIFSTEDIPGKQETNQNKRVSRQDGNEINNEGNSKQIHGTEKHVTESGNDTLYLPGR